MKISEINSGEGGEERVGGSAVKTGGTFRETSVIHVRGQQYIPKAEDTAPGRELRPHHSCGGGGCEGCTRGLYWYPKGGTMLERLDRARRGASPSTTQTSDTPATVLPMPGVRLGSTHKPESPQSTVISLPVNRNQNGTTGESTSNRTGRVLRFPPGRGGVS